MLLPSTEPLSLRYDLAMLDLDGVVYVDGLAVPGAPEHLSRARGAGMRLAFVTNNASRPPAMVATNLVEIGVPCAVADVVTSAQAAARVLLDRLGPGRPVVVLGAEGLLQAVRDVGLVPVDVEAAADALVTGYGPDVRWGELMRAAVRVRDGLWWVASNTDLTFPAGFGVAPGHGVLVDMVSRFSGVVPVVAGKPSPPLLAETVRRTGARRPLMVGDRLDTDIEGGSAAGVDTLLVLTGVTDLAVLAAALPHLRPTYLSPDLAGLIEAHPAPVVVDGVVRVGGWRAEVVGARLVVEDSGDSGDSGGPGDVADWWRAAAVACWRHLDATGEPAEVADAQPPAAPRAEPAG